MNAEVAKIWLGAVLLLTLSSVVVAFRMRDVARQSPWLTLLTIVPATVMILLFYTLAIHMYETLGDWPKSIGEEGFPRALIVHADLAAGYFSLLLVASLWIWPMALVICGFVRRWRKGLYYLGVYSLSMLTCVALMMIAPARFLEWWWD